MMAWTDDIDLLYICSPAYLNKFLPLTQNAHCLFSFLGLLKKPLPTFLPNFELVLYGRGTTVSFICKNYG